MNAPLSINQSTSRNHHSHFQRRIPRGSSGQKCDSITRLKRQAVADKKRVTNMMHRVKDDGDLEALHAIHVRLVEVIQTIHQDPGAVTTGTYDIITDAMSEARAIYVHAAKHETPRQHQRKGKGKSKSITMRYSGTEDDESFQLRTPSTSSLLPTASRRDPAAEAFQNGLNGTRYGIDTHEH